MRRQPLYDDEEGGQAPAVPWAQLRDEVMGADLTPPEAFDPEPVALPPAQSGVGGSGFAPPPAPKPARAPGYGAGLDDAALRDAQDDAGTMSNRARLYDSFKGLGEAIAGVRKPREDGVARSLEAEGKAGVDNVIQRRAGVAQQLDVEGKQRAAASSADDDDPASEASTRIVGLVGQVVPGMAGAVKGMSRAQVLQVLPFMEKIEAMSAAKQAKAAELAAEKVKAIAARQAKLDDDEARRKFDAGEHALNRSQSAENAKLMAGAQAAGAGTRSAERHDDKVTTSLEKYGEKVAGPAEEFLAQKGQIDTLLEKYKDKRDLPGVGPLDNSILAFDAFRSPDGLAMQKYAGQMMAAYQKLVTGTGGSAEELANIKRIGADLGSEKGFRAGVKALGVAFDAKMRALNASYDPEVIRTYQGRNPQQRAAPQDAAAGPPPTMVLNGKTLRLQPDGTYE